MLLRCNAKWIARDGEALETGRTRREYEPKAVVVAFPGRRPMQYSYSGKCAIHPDVAMKWTVMPFVDGAIRELGRDPLRF